jgi:phosphomevalonate kinase
LTVSTSIPGKLILLGEYAVLEGAPAVVTAVSKFAKITLKKTDKYQFYFNAPNLEINNVPFTIENDLSLIFNTNLNKSKQNQLSLFKKIFLYIYNYIQNQNKIPIPCILNIDTRDFYFENTTQKLGLGSSAALTVGLVYSLCKFNNIQFTNLHDLFILALNAHLEAQEKTGSGIDIAASTFKGVGIFKKSLNNYSYDNIKLPNDLHLIPIWTGFSTFTPDFVSKTNQLKRNKSDLYNKILKELADLSNQGCNYLLKYDTMNFLGIVNQYNKVLQQLGESAGIPIISKMHRKIAQIVQDCNGFYKPSGAGGNDIGIALTNDIYIKKEIIEKINKSQYKYIKLETI